MKPVSAPCAVVDPHASFSRTQVLLADRSRKLIYPPWLAALHSHCILPSRRWSSHRSPKPHRLPLPPQGKGCSRVPTLTIHSRGPSARRVAHIRREADPFWPMRMRRRPEATQTTRVPSPIRHPPGAQSCELSGRTVSVKSKNSGKTRSGLWIEFSDRLALQFLNSKKDHFLIYKSIDWALGSGSPST
jgi:hypothetical protein